MVNAFRWMVFVIGLAVVIGSIMVTSASDPILFIDSPSDGESVDYDTITVSGRARGTDYAVLKSVMVNDVLATDTILWHAEISLHTGSNLITVVAMDDMRQSSSETITVYYNAPTTPPPPTTTPNGPDPIVTPTPTLTPPLTGSISITTIPSGAEVRLDDSFEGITPIALKDITVGFHSIKVTKEGYHSETRKTRLDEGKTKKLNIPLKPLIGSISISSTPSGACVYLDGDYKRETPLLLSKVVVGSHAIKLTKSDYFDGIRTVEVYVGKTHQVHVNLTGYGSLDISSDPCGATVYLDDADNGETPKNINMVVAGKHTIKLTKFGYDDEIRNVSVSVGETLYLNENLTGYGSLIISSNPSRACVYLDGNYKGETPKNISDVDVGLHALKLTKRFYADVEKEILVSAGETKSVSEPLSTSILLILSLECIGGIVAVVICGILAYIYRGYFSKFKNYILGRMKRNG